MALFDFLKNKKQAEKSRKPSKKTSKKPSSVEVEKKQVEKPEPSKSAHRTLKGKNFAFEAIKQPHISEKATYLSEGNQYVFDVLPGYNKKQIKDSVEGIYGVDVLSVNIIKVPAKKRRLGRTEGFRKAYRKAIVKIKQGQKIEIL